MDSTSLAQPVNAPKQQALGTNISGLANYSPQWVFVDLMKQSSNWITQNINKKVPWDTGMSKYISKDENGYPTEIPFLSPDGTPQKVVILAGNNSYPSGDYLLLFDGSGEINISGNNLTSRREAPGRYIITLTQGSRINIEINKSVKGNHIRNIRLIMPGFHDNYQQQIFHPLFLERLQGFSVLRFMDLMNANNNKSVTWEDRTKLSNYTQAVNGFGMAPEYISALANRVEADVWITIPHMADDNYIKELATLLRQQLDPNKKIYVEYSNELWNAQFPQTKWLWRAGCENPDTFVPNKSKQDWGITGCDDLLSGFNFHVQRIVRIAEIFDEVFQDTFKERIVKVVASQAASSTVSEQLLKRFSDPNLNPKGYQPDALAIAPYFGNIAKQLDKQGIVNTITVEELLNRVQAHMESKSFQSMLKHKQIANKYNTSLIAYEGGQHITPTPQQRKNKAFVEKMIEANRSPKMKELYLQYFKYWFDTLDGGVFNNFSYVSSPGPYGSWGVLETQDQPISEAPKYSALLEIIDYLAQKR